ncbi:MAG TPA: MBL fold metallo-hydrolase, partial [Dehalococcoidia bacterium]
MPVPTLAIGRVTVAALLDAPMRARPAALFRDVPEEAWEPFRDVMDAEGRLVLSIGSYLVRTPERTVLVDTGIGGRERRGFPMGALPESLREAGVRPEEVDLVVHTHLHIDHTGWNTVETEAGPAP